MEKKKTAIYFKCLNKNGTAPTTNTHYSLPFRDRFGRLRPGLWMTVEGNLEVCQNGLHLATRKSLAMWAKARRWNHPRTVRRVFVAEIMKGSDRLRSKHKVCARTIRLVREVEYGSTEWVALGLFVHGIKR